MNSNQVAYTQIFHLTAGECDATGHMPLPLLTERLIEVATEHANRLGIGYARLHGMGIGWVLSRLSVEMTHFPRINDSYAITTWIEAINSRFSERNMCIRNESTGQVLGYARTVWVAIDYTTRSMADISHVSSRPLPVADLPCPISKFPKLRPLELAAEERPYTFRYCDLDFNRHVNTVRYIELLLNSWPLEYFDTHRIGRFDISFMHECHFGQQALVCIHNQGDGSRCEIKCNGQRMVANRILWSVI